MTDKKRKLDDAELEMVSGGGEIYRVIDGDVGLIQNIDGSNGSQEFDGNVGPLSDAYDQINMMSFQYE